MHHLMFVGMEYYERPASQFGYDGDAYGSGRPVSQRGGMGYWQTPIPRMVFWVVKLTKLCNIFFPRFLMVIIAVHLVSGKINISLLGRLYIFYNFIYQTDKMASLIM